MFRRTYSNITGHHFFEKAIFGATTIGGIGTYCAFWGMFFTEMNVKNKRARAQDEAFERDNPTKKVVYQERLRSYGNSISGPIYDSERVIVDRDPNPSEIIKP